MAREDLRVTGALQLRELATRMKEAGRGDLRREMAKGLRTASRPLLEDAARRARALPIHGERKRGGASARQARREFVLGKRKKPQTEEAKLRVHRSSGLREMVAKTPQAKVTTGARTAAMRMKTNLNRMPPDQRSLPGHLNRGRWKHPVFANRRNWVEQTAPPAWFDDAAEAKGPEVRDAAVRAVERYIEKLA